MKNNHTKRLTRSRSQHFHREGGEIIDNLLIVTKSFIRVIQIHHIFGECSQYFQREGGEIIDQLFMPRIAEGEVRVLFIGDKPAEIVHKKPQDGAVSARVYNMMKVRLVSIYIHVCIYTCT